MESTRKMLALCLLVGGLWTVTDVMAADLPDLGETSEAQAKTHQHSATAAESLNKDALCTKCHDETEIKPVLAIY